MIMRRISLLHRFTLTLFIVLLVFTVSFAGCAGVSAAPHATLNKVMGQVSLQRSGTGNWVSASAGTSLQLGDRVRTGAESRAVIVFFEGSVAELQENTEIQLQEMRKDGGATSVKLREELGTTSSRVEKLIDAKSRYEVETPAGSALVRGSVMGVIVMHDGTTIVDAIKGSCWAVAQGVEVLIQEGQRSIIYPRYAPTGAASPSASIGHPAIANPSGQAPAFFNIEPYEEKKVVCRKTPEVATLGGEIVVVSGEETSTYLLRLRGDLLDMCPGSIVEVSFEWGTASGEYAYKTGPQLLTEPGEFSFDVDLYSYISGDILELDYYFRAEADGGASGIGYGIEGEYLPVQQEHYYQIFIIGEAVAWDEAVAAAAALAPYMGMQPHLATITSSEEQAYLAGLSEACSWLWLGASDAAIEGTWTWITGEPFVYSNWLGGEPNGSTTENYLEWNCGGWNDNSNLNRPIGYIVEWD